jgi:hypothetical protein
MYTNENKKQQFTLINVKLRTNGIGKWNRMNNCRNSCSIRYNAYNRSSGNDGSVFCRNGNI